MERLSLDQKGALGSIDLTSACALLLLFLLLRRVLSSPDAPSSKRVPGPLLARYTYLPWLYHNYLLQSPKWIHHLHRQYGPVVRLSPYCVSISSPEHLTSIFSLDKEVFYDKFFNYGVAPMFSMRTRKEHSARRRIIGGQYTRAGAARPRHVAMYVEKARLLAEEMVKEAKEGDEEGTVNVFWWFSCLAMDVITAFVRLSRPYQSPKVLRRPLYAGFRTGGRHELPSLGQTPCLLLRVSGKQHLPSTRSAR